MACRLAFQSRRFSFVLSRTCIPHEQTGCLFIQCPKRCGVFSPAIHGFLSSVSWTCILTIPYINGVKPLWFPGEFRGKGICVSRSLSVPVRILSAARMELCHGSCHVKAADGDEQDAVSARRAPCSKFSCVFISQKHSGLLWNRVSLILSL